MKTSKKKVSFLILLFLICALTFCNRGQRRFKNLKYEGTLFESKGGPSKSGIIVSLYACMDGTAKDMCNIVLLGQSTTDSLGHFEITVKEARSNRYKVTLSDGKNENEITGTWPHTTQSELKNNYSEIFYK